MVDGAFKNQIPSFLLFSDYLSILELRVIFDWGKGGGEGKEGAERGVGVGRW